MGSSPMELGPNKRDFEVEFGGVLRKWTNYILGWQCRFFVLRQGNLLYYKSETDVKFGCRGAINLSNASLVVHKFDECRFDVHICDLIWYLRSETPEEKRKWVNALTAHTKTPRNSQNPLYPSVFSVSLRERLQDVKSCSDRLSKLSEILLKRLDTSQALENGESNLVTGLNHSTIAADMSNFQNAVSELLSMMFSCVDMIEARGKFLIYGRDRSDASVVTCSSDSPEMVEGQHCLLGDDEFFDAVESSLEKIEEEAEMKKKLESRAFEQALVTEHKIVDHSLWSKISQKTEEQITLATTGLNDRSWELLLDEDGLKMYSKEMEVDGLVMDPLTAICTVKGVTGREICHYFFCPQYRQDWEPTVEQMDVVERIGQNVIIFHQVYKRVWPTAQRDTLFWSHLVRQTEPGSPDVWAVVNDSLELPQLPANDGKLVRVSFTACLYCVTEIARLPPYTRDDVTCRLTYCTAVNPGGWVPASAVRALRRKEYPKFLKKFTSYVIEKTANTEIII